jgi:hypothetical protein
MAQQMSVLGIDIAKLVFHVVGMDDTGAVVVRKIIAAFSPLCAATTLSRSPVEIRLVHQWLR